MPANRYVQCIGKRPTMLRIAGGHKPALHHTVVGNEGQEGGLVGQDVSAHLLSHDQAGAHAGVGRDVPLGVVSEGLSFLGDAQVSRPQSQLLGVGTGTVATGNESVLALGDGSESVQNRSSSLNTGGVSGRTSQDEVVVDKGQTLSLEAIDNAAETVSDESLFLALGVDQNQVSIAGLGSSNGLAGTGGLNFDSVAVSSLESGQQVTQQAGVLNGSGGGQTDNLGLLGGGSDLTGVDGSVPRT